MSSGSYQFCCSCMHRIDENATVCPLCGFPISNYTPPPNALPSMTILHGRYLVGRVLGSGGFGITYVARDLTASSCRRVCIKEFFLRTAMYRQDSTGARAILNTGAHQAVRLHESTLRKFEQEAAILYRFGKVPGIVNVYDYFSENDTSYIVMEYLEGRTLQEEVYAQGGRLTWDYLQNKLKPVFSSLETLHANNVFHRDISPDNLMVLPDGTIKLFDFGGARVQIDPGAMSTMVIRKAGYTPVEQYSRGRQGPWTDVYAMAATIYYCLTGKRPTDAAERVSGRELPAPSAYGVHLPGKVEHALHTALALMPENRYQTMQQFSDALFDDEPGQEKPPRGYRRQELSRGAGPQKDRPEDQPHGAPQHPDSKEKKQGDGENMAVIIYITVGVIILITALASVFGA